MKYIQVVDETLRDKLLSHGYQMMPTKFNVMQSTVWTFLYDESRPLCFDIDNAITNSQCILTDKFKMTF